MNKELNFAVCDDDEIVCEAICTKISKILTSCGISVSCDKYVSPMSLYNNIKHGERVYDALFLDIDMPKIDGVELAKALRKNENMVDIIFVSNREDKVFETLAVRVYPKKQFYSRLEGYAAFLYQYARYQCQLCGIKDDE